MSLKRRLAVPAAVLAVLGGSAGTAAACHGDGSSTAATQASFTTFHHGGMWHGGWLGSTVTSYLGLQPAQIKADLAAGKTLAQIADATPGKSSAGLVSAIVAPLQTKLNALVSANKLSTTTESTMMANVTAKVTAAVNGQFHFWWWHHA
jgi:hypothetical protein